jgi:hypothetical protein
MSGRSASRPAKEQRATRSVILAFQRGAWERENGAMGRGMANDVRLPLSQFHATAALYVLESFDGTTLIKAADALLDAGIYTWSVGELATSPYPAVRDLRRLFELSLRELGIPLPSPEEAACTLARWHLCAAIEGRESPSQAAFRLRDDLSFPLHYDRRLNSLEPQLRFISYWSNYDELQYEVEAGLVNHEEAVRATTQVDREFLEHARSWMYQDGPSLIDPRWLSWNDEIVRKLAQAIANERSWDRLPILADALEEAGCGNCELLEHCRAGEPHDECCWIIDILLLNEASRSP